MNPLINLFMVTLHSPIFNTQENMPVMPRHNLEAKVKTKTCEVGQRITVFIQKMKDGRYAIMDATFSYETQHYEIHTEQSLHDSFNEVD